MVSISFNQQTRIMIIPQAAIRWWNGLSEDERIGLLDKYFCKHPQQIQISDVIEIYAKESNAN